MIQIGFDDEILVGCIFSHFCLHQIGLRCTTVEDLRHRRSASLASRAIV